MKKVFIIHGFEGQPNGAWRPWLMAELDKQDIYACALSMPSPELPLCNEWVEEISRHVERNTGDEIYLIGHSLGVPAILRYLENAIAKPIAGAVLLAGPAKTSNAKIKNFLDRDFDFEKITSLCKKFAVIHGDDDPLVPLEDARFLAHQLEAKLLVIEGGKHLNGSAGLYQFPQCLEVLKAAMM